MVSFGKCVYAAILATVFGLFLSVPWLFIWWWVSFHAAVPSETRFVITATCTILIVITDTASIMFFAAKLAEGEL